MSRGKTDPMPYPPPGQCDREQSGKTILTSDTSCRFGDFSKTTLGSILEGLTRLSEGFHTHTMVYYKERMQMRRNQGNKHVGQSRRTWNVEFSAIFPKELAWYFAPGTDVWQYTWNTASRGKSPEPQGPESIKAPIFGHVWLIACTIDFSLQPFQRLTDIIWPKAFTSNLTVTIWCGQLHPKSHC